MAARGGGGAGGFQSLGQDEELHPLQGMFAAYPGGTSSSPFIVAEEAPSARGLLLAGEPSRGCVVRTSRWARALLAAVAVLGLAAGLRGPQAPSFTGPRSMRSMLGLSEAHDAHPFDMLEPATSNADELAHHQFVEGKGEPEECHTAEEGELCFNAVHWAMFEGIKVQPHWYPGLTNASSFKDFQAHLHKEGHHSCPMPCSSDGKPVKDHETDGGHGGGHAEDHVHGYLSLCFLVGGLSIGCILQVAQERLVPSVPYTCLLFLTGLLLAGIHELRPEGHWSSWPTWYISVSMWEQVDPHLIFYIFLPALVFAEAMRLNVKLALSLFPQVLLLAVPGVVIGTGLTAVFSHNVLPYHWSWPTCLVFGSILAATDPVAVVALFNTLGVSPKLTMLISGESLLNDGTAIVLFTITLKLMLGGTVSAVDFGCFFAQMTVLAVLLGIALAYVALIIIAWCAETQYHTDAMIQVCVTICLAMLCFFVAESEVHTSGVLTVVAAGCVFSYYAWPRFASRETMHIVWEAVEFVGNTVVFLLAGLLFGHRCITRGGHLTYADIGWLAALYVAVSVIRGAMVLVLWPLLNCLGEKVTWKEALVMVWSGLRGAVGLVLAIVVDEEPSIAPQIGSHFMFHIGGIAMLTIIINATLCAPLLKSLGLTTPPEIDERMTHHFEKLAKQHAREALAQIQAKQEKDMDRRWAGANAEKVRALLPSLAEAEGHAAGHGHGADDSAAELRVYREAFLRCVQGHYWNDLEEGLIPRTSRFARLLLFSVSDGLLNCSRELRDWAVLQDKSDDWQICPCVNKCITMWPLKHWQGLQSAFPSDDTVVMWKVYMTLCFIDAHESTREEVVPYFEGTGLSQAVKDQVHEESRKQTEDAAAFLKKLSPESVEHGKARMLAGKLIAMQMEKVDSMAKQGVLDDKGAGHIMHHLQEERRLLARGG